MLFFAQVAFQREEVKQGLDSPHRTIGNPGIDGCFVYLLVMQYSGAVIELRQQEVFQSQGLLQLFPGSRLGNPSLHVVRVGQQPFLPHQVDIAYDGLLAHAQHVGQIVNPAFRLPVAIARGGAAADKRPYDAGGLFAVVLVEERREGQPSTSLFHIAHGDACREDMGHIVASLDEAGSLKGGDGSLHPCLYVDGLLAPARLTCNLQRRTAEALLCGCQFLDGLPHLLYFADA